MPPQTRSLHAVGGEHPAAPVDGPTPPPVGGPTPPPVGGPTLPAVDAPALPPETAPEAPDLLVALEAGDDAAVWAWVRAYVPEPESLVVYALLVAVGVAGLVEWPALVITALGQFVVDRRFAAVESVAAGLRTRVQALGARVTG